MNKLVIPCSYMGSGSSALTDLISEFHGFSRNNGSFEYIFLHCPGGLFDLEDKLLRNNNALRSDEALREFRINMHDLFVYRLWWPGNYRKQLSPRFMKCVDEFIEQLTMYTSNCSWYYQEKLPYHLLPISAAKLVLQRITHNAAFIHPTLTHSPMQISLPSEQDFYLAARRFLDKIFDEMGRAEHNLVIDQLLLPHNLYRFERYFDEESYCFVVQRDPRDVFLINKYIWLPKNTSVPFPTDVEEFCKYYRRMREIEQKVDSNRIIRLNFEDLIYRYDESCEVIQSVLEIPADAHFRKKQSFNPAISINNTQLFLLKSFQKEAEIIAHQLPEYTYTFPYIREPKTSLSF